MKRQILLKMDKNSYMCKKIHMNVQLAYEKVLSISCTTQMYTLKCKLNKIEAAVRFQFNTLLKWLKFKRIDNTKC